MSRSTRANCASICRPRPTKASRSRSVISQHSVLAGWWPHWTRWGPHLEAQDGQLGPSSAADDGQAGPYRRFRLINGGSPDLSQQQRPAPGGWVRAAHFSGEADTGEPEPTSAPDVITRRDNALHPTAARFHHRCGASRAPRTPPTGTARCSRALPASQATGTAAIDFPARITRKPGPPSRGPGWSSTRAPDWATRYSGPDAPHPGPVRRLRQPGGCRRRLTARKRPAPHGMGAGRPLAKGTKRRGSAAPWTTKSSERFV